jgi:ZIP family zinc transporter
MSSAQILLLGAIAGLTIFLGLPLARLSNPSPRLQAALSSLATGILLFLLWDVLSEGVAPVEEALKGRAWGEFSGYAALLAGGFGVGLLSLVYYDRWMARQRGKTLLGPGAAAAAEFESVGRAGSLTPGRFLAVLIATGVGLHNFSEGLAIGQSAAKGSISLALMLIIGFGLHNATEGFGIVAPLCGERERPSWRFLATLGLIGGGPTFLGTVIGKAVVSEPLSIAFFALAAGSILYVVMELLNVTRRLGEKTVVAWALFAGLALGFGTDFVLAAVGA